MDYEMVKEDFIIQMVAYMMDNGKMDQWMVMVCYITQMGKLLIKEIGKMINLMEMALFIMKIHKIFVDSILVISIY